LNCHVDLLYWYIQEDDIESAFTLVQKDATELCEFIKMTVHNPFICDLLTKEGTKGKLVEIYHCIERLFELMGMIETEFETKQDISEHVDTSPTRPKEFSTKPSIINSEKRNNSTVKSEMKGKAKQFKITTPLSKKNVEQNGFAAACLQDNLNKMK